MAGNNVRKRNNAKKSKQEEKQVKKIVDDIKDVKSSKNSKNNSNIVYFYVICAIAVFVLSSFSSNITRSLKSFQNGLFESSHKVEEVYSGNELLNDQFILEKSLDFSGADGVVEDENFNIYTGLRSGEIMKIHPSKDGEVGEGRQEIFFEAKIQKLAKTDPKAQHGRPLGMRIVNNVLYVADAIYGVYKIDLDTKKATPLVKIDQATPKMSLPNDLDVSSEGEIFFTDSSSKHHLNDLQLSEDKSSCVGRLFKYTEKTNKLEVVKDKLCFANGVQLNYYENLVVVAEMMAKRVLFIDTKTFRVVRSLKVNGYPDNIRMNSDGNYYIAVNSNLINNRDDSSETSVVEVSKNGKTVRNINISQTNQSLISHCSDLSDGRVAVASFFGEKLSFGDLNE